MNVKHLPIKLFSIVQLGIHGPSDRVRVRFGPRFQFFVGRVLLGPVLHFKILLILVRSGFNRFWSVDPWAHRSTLTYSGPVYFLPPGYAAMGKPRLPSSWWSCKWSKIPAKPFASGRNDHIWPTQKTLPGLKIIITPSDYAQTSWTTYTVRKNLKMI